MSRFCSLPNYVSPRPPTVHRRPYDDNVRALVWTTVAIWMFAERLLRVPQRRHTQRTVTREWRSLFMIWTLATEYMTHTYRLIPGVW